MMIMVLIFPYHTRDIHDDVIEGDSRAVLCRRDGEALALSTDHKPSLKIESDRITRAGKRVDRWIYRWIHR